MGFLGHCYTVSTTEILFLLFKDAGVLADQITLCEPGGRIIPITVLPTPPRVLDGAVFLTTYNNIAWHSKLPRCAVTGLNIWRWDEIPTMHCAVMLEANQVVLI